MSIPYPQSKALLNGVTATTNATAPSSVNAYSVDVSHSQLMSIQFTASAITSGNGVFVVWVSNDGTNWVQYNRLTDNVTNTNVQTDTRVSSVTLSANSTKIYFFAVGDYFKYVSAGVTRTTDGTYSATIAYAG